MALDPKEYSAIQKARKGLLYPDLVNSVALKVLPKETAEAEGWTTYADMAPCAAGHVAPKFCANSLCVDCWRERQGRETIHPRAKNRTYKPGSGPRPAATGAPVVMAPAAPIEPSKIEQRFLTELAETRDFDAAAAAVGWTRGLVDSRAVSNPVFKESLEALIARCDIARTRVPDAESSKWTPELEKQVSRRLVDCGLTEQVRQEFGITASDWNDHLSRSPTFYALIANAKPVAEATLHERSLHAAASGNDRLLKILNDKKEEPQSYSNLSHHQINAEITQLLQHFDKQGLLPPYEFKHKVTGQRIDRREYEPVNDATPDNSDLVS